MPVPAWVPAEWPNDPVEAGWNCTAGNRDHVRGNAILALGADGWCEEHDPRGWLDLLDALAPTPDASATVQAEDNEDEEEHNCDECQCGECANWCDGHDCPYYGCGYRCDECGCSDCDRPYRCEASEGSLCENCDYYHWEVCESPRTCDECRWAHQARACVCGDCDRRRDTRRLSLEPVTGDVSLAKFLKLPRTVGLEIELETDDEVDPRRVIEELPHGVGIGYDGSLADYPQGAETRLPPGYGEYYEDKVRGTLAVLKKHGYGATQQTGLHVHVDCKIDERRKWMLYALVVATQYSLYRLAPERERNQYCQPLTTSLEDALALAGLNSQRNDGGVSRTPGHTGKYSIVNFATDEAYGTAEFRMMRALTDESEVLAWAALCQHMVEFAASRERSSRYADDMRALARLPDGLFKLNKLFALVKLPDEARGILSRMYTQENAA